LIYADAILIIRELAELPASLDSEATTTSKTYKLIRQQLSGFLIDARGAFRRSAKLEPLDEELS
jgi:hypothetical protein